jgi:hypothetical protein
VSWTKQQIIAAAYAELGVADYDFDVQPEEQESALRRLDAMMAVWDGKGIRLGYPLPSSTDVSSLDQDSGLPDTALEPVFLGLALRLAPSIGKTVSVDTRRNASDGFDRLQIAAAQPLPPQQPNTMPRGAGNKPWRPLSSPFFPKPTDSPLQVTTGGDLNITES